MSHLPDEFDDLQIDDVLGDLEAKRSKKKRKNSKQKGNRVERQLCKLLTEHFGETFSRSVGSGNRWGQVGDLPAHAKETLVGDICAPEHFRWVIECKGGYDDGVDFSSVFDGGCATIDGFLEQSDHDADLSGKKPLTLWKRSRKPWLAMVPEEELPTGLDFRMRYRDRGVCGFDALLSLTDRAYWFSS